MTEAAINIQARTAYHNERPYAAKGKLRIMTKQTKAQEAKVEPYMAKMADGSLHAVHSDGDVLLKVNGKIVAVSLTLEKAKGKGTDGVYDLTTNGSAYVTWIQPHVTRNPQMLLKLDKKTKKFAPLMKEDWEPIHQYLISINEKAALVSAELGTKDGGTVRFILPEPEAPEDRPKPPKPSKNDKRLQLQ